jgi:hypothetical protein
MGHLFRRSGKNHDIWSNGYAPFFTNHEHGLDLLLVAINCRMGDLPVTEIALLDTGAAWSVIDRDTARILGDQLGPSSGTATLITRYGRFRGNLHRLKITLLADENCGSDLSVDGTVFVSEEDWPGPIVLGYHGCLERIRIALDPGLTDGQQIFFFGEIR